MSSDGKPNIGIITIRDTRGHLGCYGPETVHSEAIDAMATDGCLFTNYLATGPVCSASRGTMMTRWYEQPYDLMGLLHPPWWWRLNWGERHRSHMLEDADYHTALSGVHHETAYHEEELCFHEIHSPGGESCVRVARRAFSSRGYGQSRTVLGSVSSRPTNRTSALATLR